MYSSCLSAVSLCINNEYDCCTENVIFACDRKPQALLLIEKCIFERVSMPLGVKNPLSAQHVAIESCEVNMIYCLLVGRNFRDLRLCRQPKIEIFKRIKSMHTLEETACVANHYMHISIRTHRNGPPISARSVCIKTPPTYLGSTLV